MHALSPKVVSGPRTPDVEATGLLPPAGSPRGELALGALADKLSGAAAEGLSPRHGKGSRLQLGSSGYASPMRRPGEGVAAAAAGGAPTAPAGALLRKASAEEGQGERGALLPPAARLSRQGSSLLLSAGEGGPSAAAESVVISSPARLPLSALMQRVRQAWA